MDRPDSITKRFNHPYSEFMNPSLFEAKETLFGKSSSSTAFYTLISVAMLPYNQSFSFVCLFLFVFPLLRVRCVKRKEKKVGEKGGHFTVEKEVK